MSAPHTPGPWLEDEAGICAESWGVIAVACYPESFALRDTGEMTQAETAEHAANARLIAAAPDLLEAAKEGLICAEADVEEARRDCIEHGEDPDADRFVKVFTERRDLIRAAIAKATGADS